MSDRHRPAEHEIYDVEELAAYSPILGCAIVPFCLAALALAWLLSIAEAPRWSTLALMLAYATLPCAAFAWWTWNKPAIRLRDGRVLRTADARKLAAALWLTTALVLLWRFVSW